MLFLYILIGLYIFSAIWYATISVIVFASIYRKPNKDANAMFNLYFRGFLESIAIIWLLWIRLVAQPQLPMPPIPWLFFIAVNFFGIPVRFYFFKRFFLNKNGKNQKT